MPRETPLEKAIAWPSRYGMGERKLGEVIKMTTGQRMLAEAEKHSDKATGKLVQAQRMVSLGKAGQADALVEEARVCLRKAIEELGPE